jgi:CheY-like chemotaxis protein
MSRICLVDDDILVRDALALGLSDFGYEVLTAPGAAAGLDLVSRRQIDALVTDINMPGADGGQLIADARARWPLMPIVAISGAAAVGGNPLSEVAADLGADAVLMKPFRARQLAELIERLLAARRT